MNYELYFYIGIIILGLILIIYQIHKYGLRGYLDRKLERKKRKYLAKKTRLTSQITLKKKKKKKEDYK